MPRVGVTMSIIGEDGQTTAMYAAREEHVPVTAPDYKVALGHALMRLDELVADASAAVHQQGVAHDIVDPRSE